jgi:two-component system cell cycle sensor histidine kinase/response regulator CckA
MRMGYRVHTAPTGVAAITVWEQEHGRIDMLITDIVMPDGMNGWDLVRELRSRHSDLRVICMSGYSAGIASPPGPALERVTFLQKPFSLDRLTEAVRASLDAR